MGHQLRGEAPQLGLLHADRRPRHLRPALALCCRRGLRLTRGFPPLRLVPGDGVSSVQLHQTVLAHPEHQLQIRGLLLLGPKLIQTNESVVNINILSVLNRQMQGKISFQTDESLLGRLLALVKDEDLVLAALPRREHGLHAVADYLLYLEGFGSKLVAEVCSHQAAASRDRLVRVQRGTWLQSEYFLNNVPDSGYSGGAAHNLYAVNLILLHSCRVQKICQGFPDLI